MIIVDRKIAGNTEKIPLSIGPRLENETAMAITIPAMRLLPRSFSGV